MKIITRLTLLALLLTSTTAFARFCFICDGKIRNPLTFGNVSVSPYYSSNTIRAYGFSHSYGASYGVTIKIGLRKVASSGDTSGPEIVPLEQFPDSPLLSQDERDKAKRLTEELNSISVLDVGQSDEELAAELEEKAAPILERYSDTPVYSEPELIYDESSPIIEPFEAQKFILSFE